MAGESVGSVYLEIGSEVAKGTPKESIEKIRAAVRKAAAIKMPIALDNLKRAAVSAARAQAQEMADSAREIRLPTGLKAPVRASITAARRAGQKLADTATEIHFRTDLRTITATEIRDVKRAAERIANTTPISFNVEPGKGATWHQALEDLIEDVEDHEAELPVIPDVDTKWTAARLKWLTRPRSVPIVPTMDKGALGLVTTQLLALSGARAVTDRIRSLSTALQNLDRSLPAIAGVSTAITNLGSGALAASSNLLVMGGSLASIANLGLLLPGMFAGFGVGIGVMIVGLSDLFEKLDDLGPKFTQLQRQMGDAFSGQAEAAVRNLVDAWLPTLSKRLTEVSTEMGNFFASMANAASSADNVGHLDSILVSVRDSVDIAGEGIAHFTDAMMGLADVGASYLPALASWFNRISESFSAWIENATNTGEIFTWIDQGIVALQDLGRVVWGLGGIFSNMATAAAAAGGSTLGDFADGLAKVNAALEGPVWQGALTTVFRGAHDAMAALGPGVSALGDAFLSLAPTLAQIMVLAGQIGSVALTAISAAFQNPAFQGGLVDFFSGVLSGVSAVAPAMPALASAFGAVASFAGTLASVLGPVLGAAIEALAPVVTDLMSGLSAIAPVLGGVLVSAIQAVAPFIQQIVGAITEWVVNNPQLATTILAVVAVIGGLVAGAASLVGALLPVISTIVSIVTAIIGAGGLTVVLGTVSAGLSAFAAAAAPIIAVVAALMVGITAFAGALVYAWTTSEAFRNAVVGLFQALMAAAQPVIAFLMGTVVPVVMQIVQAIINGVQMILGALTPLMTVIIQIVTQIITLLTPLIAFILSVLAPVFTFLGTVVSAAFTFIATVITNVINIITAILQVFLAVLQGNWTGAWMAIRNVIMVVWQAIQNIVGAGITYARTVITAGLNLIRGLWTAIWGGIRAFVTAVWNGIKSSVSNGISTARSVISSGLNAIRSAWTSVWNTISGFISAVMNRIQAYIKVGIGRARQFVATGMNAIRSVFSSVWNAVSSLVSSVFGRIVSFITSGISRARSAVSSGMSAVRSTFSNVLSAIASAVRGAIGRVVSGFQNMMSRARSTVAGFVGRFRSVGGDIVSGLVNGIKNAAGRAVSAARDVVGNALNAAKSKLGISSPSKAFAEVGMWSGEGFVKGIEDMSRATQRAAEEMVAVPSPAPLRIPASAIGEPIIRPTADTGTGATVGADTTGAGGLDLSPASIQALAETMARMSITLKVGNRQAGTLYMAGSGANNTLGGNA